MNISIAKILSGLALSLSVTACGQPGDELLTNSGDELGEVTSALCTDDAAVNYSAAMVPQPFSSGMYFGKVSSMSPSATYGSAVCSKRYVVEATNMLFKPGVTVAAGAHFTQVLVGQPVTPEQCADLKVYMLVYGFNAATNSWEQFGSEKTATGAWLPESSTCNVNASTYLGFLAYYSKVRVAAKMLYDGFIYHYVSGAITTYGPLS